MLEEYDKIIIYGSGTGAEFIIKNLSENIIKDKLSAIIDRDNSSRIGEYVHGFQIKSRINLKKYLGTKTAIIVASQYFKEIYPQLIAICNTWNGQVDVDFYVINTYYNVIYPGMEIPLPYTDEKYIKLENILQDDESLDTLAAIKKYRNRNFLYKYTEKETMLFGNEAYWEHNEFYKKYSEALVIDGGAYIGDSISLICTNISENVRKYYAFEPAEEAFSILEKLPKRTDSYQELLPVKGALWSRTENLFFSLQDNAPAANHISNGVEVNKDAQSVKGYCIDDLELDTDCDIFIKMDIEGSELAALKGAEKLIKKRKPNLAVCLYHKSNDIVEIPLYIKQLVPEYKIFLRGGGHTICIAHI